MRKHRIIGLAALCVGVLLPAASAAALPQYVAVGDSYSSGVGTRVFYTRQGGYDTHAGELGPHAGLLRELGGALLAFLDDLTAAKLAERVTVLCFSEFGLVTITIGGNDAGFSNVIINCALYYFTCGSAINEANSFIANKLPGLLDTTYNNIRSRATTAHVVVLGYPHLFTAEGKTCNVNFLTSSNEKKLNETGDKLDGVIKARSYRDLFGNVLWTGSRDE